MSPDLIRFDADKCTACGLCGRDCVSGTILSTEGKPEVKTTTWCNRCGHCVAVCPTGAVIHGGLIGSPARPLSRLGPEAASSYREIALGRRSVRHFKDEAVPRAELEDLIELASCSPTASNLMDVGYVVITDRELIRKTGAKIFGAWEKYVRLLAKPWWKALFTLYVKATGQEALASYADRFPLYKSWVDSGRDIVTHHAPALIVIYGPAKGRFKDGNCHIAATNLTNYAHAKGLGTCYLGLVVTPMNQSKNLSRRLGVPEGQKAYVALAVGRPAYKYASTAVRPKPEVRWIEGIKE